jgi:phage host-nuclease inhibitor protein Gam
MKKITEQEMVDLNQLREQYSKTIFEIGQLQYEKYELENQLKTIDSELTGLYGDISSNYQRQDDYLTKIREKYGEGNLDIQTGEILP